MAGSYGLEGTIETDQLNKNLKNIDGLTYNGGKLSDTNKITDLPAMVKLNGYDIIIDRKGSVRQPNEIEKAKANGTVFEDNTLVTDAYGNSITIPKGFKIAEDSATDVTGGIVIEDAKCTNTLGSQFVWIPVGIGENAIKKSDGTTVEIELNRYTFDESGEPCLRGSDKIEPYFEADEVYSDERVGPINIADFKAKANKSHGYYIGRFEARKSSTGKLTVNGSDPGYGPSEERGVSQKTSAELSRNMYAADLPFVSDLVNSYAWDTAIVFVQTFDDRPTDKKTTPYSRQNSLNESLATNGTNNLTDTTKQDKICNIWDMASNSYEWTTELSTHSSYRSCPRVCRGGLYGAPDWKASDRRSDYGLGENNGNSSFRTILYL